VPTMLYPEGNARDMVLHGIKAAEDHDDVMRGSSPGQQRCDRIAAKRGLEAKSVPPAIAS
jgi:hypothetical protein